MRYCLITLLALVMTAPAWALRVPSPAHDPDKFINQWASGNNTFADRLYAQLVSDKGNIIYSPYSIQTALVMTMSGANGATRSEMYSALSLPTTVVMEHARPIPGQPQPWVARNYPWSAPLPDKAAGQLAKAIEEANKHKSIDLAIANSLWPAKSFKLKPAFTQSMKQYYGVTITPVTYPEPGRKAVNAWVETQTNERIKNLLPAGSVDAATQLVLVNAIYFKGLWKQPFDKRRTRDQPFHLSSDAKADVPMMTQVDRFRLTQQEHYQAVELPYEGDKLSMLLVVPKVVDGIAGLEKTLKWATINDQLKKAHQQKCIVALPRFKMEYSRALNQPLQALGMKQAFGAGADFSNMGDGDLFISLVQHKAFIEVNEEGSEAAAATAVAVMGRSAAMVSPPAIRADRPFLFAIRHNPTGTILFAGRVMNPSK